VSGTSEFRANPTIGDADLDETLADVVRRFAAAAPAMTEDAVRRQAAVVPGIDEAPAEVADARWHATSVIVELALAGVRSPAVAPAAVDAAGELAATAARSELALDTVLHVLRVTHASVVDHVLEASAGDDRAPLRAVSRHLFWYFDALALPMSRAYVAERRRLNARPERARYARIRAVLDGDSRLDLDYPLADHHVALVLAGASPAAALRRVARAAGTVPVLATETPDGRIWAWLACDLCEGDVVATLAEQPVPRTHAGVSGHEPGLAGFRGTHRKAALALRIGDHAHRPVTSFGSVALEALAFGGEALAREFVLAEIGPLVGDDRRMRDLRRTLAAYFAAGSGTGGTARALGLSERTVVYRLRHVERLLGRPLVARRAELETAVRLHELFAARPSAAQGSGASTTS
jgi:hypothetical protein